MADKVFLKVEKGVVTFGLLLEMAALALSAASISGGLEHWPDAAVNGNMVHLRGALRLCFMVSCSVQGRGWAQIGWGCQGFTGPVEVPGRPKEIHRCIVVYPPAFPGAVRCIPGIPKIYEDGA